MNKPDLKIELGDMCKCGGRRWNIETGFSKGSICGYCRSVSSNGSFACKLDKEVALTLLTAEYERTTDEAVKTKIMSSILGDHEI